MASIQAATSCLRQRWIRHVHSRQTGVSLTVVLGGLLRGDLQPRAKARKLSYAGLA